MAIQNFISGGYYGKLGATIGQRWKNKRTVKAYAVPTNPRTEKQQANRGKFAEGTVNAQLGQQLNAKAFYWQSTETTSWALRMKEALRLLSLNTSGLSQIPIIPESFNADINITKIVAKKWNDDNSLTCEITELNNQTIKTIRILGEQIDENNNILDVQIFVVKQNVENKNEITIQNATKEFFTKWSKFSIVNVPTIQGTDLSIFGAEQTIDFSAFDSKIFDLTCTSVTESETIFNVARQKYQKELTFIFANDFVDFESVNFSFSISGVVSGEKQTLTFENVSFNNNNGKASVTIVNEVNLLSQIFAYPSGSEITVINFNATAKDIKYITETTVQEFPNNVFERQYNYNDITPTITSEGLIKNIVYNLQLRSSVISSNGVNIKQASNIDLQFNENEYTDAECSVVKNANNIAEIKTTNYKANTINTNLKFNLPNIISNSVEYKPTEDAKEFDYSENAKNSQFSINNFTEIYDAGIEFTEYEYDFTNIAINTGISIDEFINLYNNKTVTFPPSRVKDLEETYIWGNADHGEMFVERKGTSNTIIVKLGHFASSSGERVPEDCYVEFNTNLTYQPTEEEIENSSKLCKFVFIY